MNKIVEEDIKSIIQKADFISKLNNKNILLIGGTGFFAKWFIILIDYLNNVFSFNISLTITIRSYKKFVSEFINIIDINKYQYIESDIENLKLDNKDFDFVLYFASPDPYVIDEEKLYNTIAQGTENIVNIFENANIERLIFTSSGAVYGCNYHNSKETDICKTNTIYAKAKKYAEESEARKREIEELKQKLEEANTKNASLCQALDDNQKSSKIASQNFTAQQEKLVTAETRIAELEQLIADKSKLEEELNAAKRKISSQAEQLTVCKEEYIILREKMQSEALANAKQEDAKIQQLQKLLDEAKSAKEGLIGELNAKADRISELESELGKSRENQEKLNAAIRKLQEEQTSLKEAAREEAAKSKASEVSELTSEIEALKRALEEKTTVISDQQVALSNMERALEVNRKNQTPSVKVYSEQKEETVKVQAESDDKPKGKLTHTPNEILHKMFENN